MIRKMLSRIYKKRWCLLLLALSMTVLTGMASGLCGQSADEIRNGGMEETNGKGEVAGWEVFGRNDAERDAWGIRYAVDSVNPFAGSNSLFVDTTELKLNSISAVQILDAKEYLGKRVCLSGVIRGLPIPDDLEEGESPGRGMFSISFHNTEHSGAMRTLGTEAAPRRLVRDGNWNRHDIVIDVPMNAETIHINLTVVGKTKAWFDQISLVAVPDDVELTTPSVLDEPQSFFNWWLVLPAVALPLFCFSFTGGSMFHRVAFRFTAVYWGIYFLTWWLFLLSFVGSEFHSELLADYFSIRYGVVNWFAWSIFEENVYPVSSGSGDTIYNYMELLTILIFSVAVTVFWSCVDWRGADHTWSKDIFRSFLRYSLAFVLLSYGLAKLNPETSQFQAPSFDRLAGSIGDSSPMGLLWTFMGASQPYSIFAGAGEVIAAILLLFRRTSIFGALVSIGVMANVVMLNFCYDVPVKLFSSHLLFASFLFLLPDLGWISNTLLFRRSATEKELIPPYADKKSIWWFRAVQAVIVFVGILYPTWQSISGWIDARNPGCFGEYLVDEFRSPYLSNEGSENELDASASDSELTKFTIRRLPFPMDDEQEKRFTDVIRVRSEDVSENYEATVNFDQERGVIEVVDFQGRKQILPTEMQVRVIDEDCIELSGNLGQGDWYVKLKRRKEEFLLTSRGFHWVSQRPFNR